MSLNSCCISWYSMLLIIFMIFQKYSITMGTLSFGPQIQGRVIGGDLTDIDKVGGFIVALLYKGQFICAGSLVQEQIVITAQHCFLGRRDIEKWTAVGGISLLNEEGVRIQVSSMMKPSSFREPDLHMDVGVVKLSEPMIGPHIKTIKLCKSSWAKNNLITIIGWGLIDPSATAPYRQLRSADVPIISKNRCRNIYASGNVTLTDSMFCAALQSKKDACTYDSGGPAVYNGELCGVISYGIGCASPKYPGVYTNINYVRPFIDNAIKILKKYDS